MPMFCTRQNNKDLKFALLPYTIFCPLFHAFCCAVMLVLNLLQQIPPSRLFPSGFLLHLSARGADAEQSGQ